jgi:hypothetical protein
MEHYLQNVRIPKDLLLRFFLTFSRFEYALKAAGFLTADHKQARADWPRFARSVQPQFNLNNSPALGNACDLFIVNPPWKQVVIGGQLHWNTSVAVSSMSELEGIEHILLMIRRVRNNLFHGAQHNSDVIEDEERKTKLIESAIVVLEECLALAPDVKKHYDDAVL